MTTASETISTLSSFVDRLNESATEYDSVIGAESIDYIWTHILGLLKSDYLFPLVSVTGKHGSDYATINGRRVKLVGYGSTYQHHWFNGEDHLRGYTFDSALMDYEDTEPHASFKNQLLARVGFVQGPVFEIGHPHGKSATSAKTLNLIALARAEVREVGQGRYDYHGDIVHLQRAKSLLDQAWREDYITFSQGQDITDLLTYVETAMQSAKRGATEVEASGITPRDIAHQFREPLKRLNFPVFDKNL